LQCVAACCSASQVSSSLNRLYAITTELSFEILSNFFHFKIAPTTKCLFADVRCKQPLQIAKASLNHFSTTFSSNCFVVSCNDTCDAAHVQRKQRLWGGYD